MAAILRVQYGNPSSIYGHGVKIRKAIEQAKQFTPLIAGHQEFNLRGGTENAFFNNYIIPSKDRFFGG